MALFSTGSVDCIVVGLGNPGKKYEGTRHNVGFMALDALAAKLGAGVTRAKFDALTGTAQLAGKKLLLMKPQTFMNLSGVAVGKAAAFYKVPAQQVIVLFDDVSLAPGKLRIRREGSAGGHNGVANIIDQLGSAAFPRIKLGVGAKPHPEMDLADWVLGRFTSPEKKLIEDRLDDVCAAVQLMVNGESETAMSRYNG